jgi:predicted transcriptional regulator
MKSKLAYLETEMELKIYSSLRQRGFLETIFVLGELPENEISQKKFFHLLKNAYHSYYNAFLRSKEKLLQSNLIYYRLDEQIQLIIGLTPKGRNFYQKLMDLERILEEPDPGDDKCP